MPTKRKKKAENGKWQLRRVLKRGAMIRGFDADDLKYCWAAYKRGAFPESMLEPGLPVGDFKEALVGRLLSRYDGIWTVVCKTPRGEMPVGFITGFFPHKELTHFLVLDQFLWYPWASARNKVEAAAKFGAETRKTHPVLTFTRHKDRDFMAVLGKLGVAHRVGMSTKVFPGERAAVWESR